MGDFVLGHRPTWELVVGGATVWVNGTPVNQQPADEWEEVEAAINRLDVELGLDMVHTCTFNLVGKDAAIAAKKLFPRRSDIQVRMGYADNISMDVMFQGTILQGFPGSTYPVTIEMAADSPMYKARELWVKETGTEGSLADNLTNFIKEETDLEMTFYDYRDVTSEKGGKVNDNALKTMTSWMGANGMHFIDAMTNEVFFFYPHSIQQVKLLGENSRRWELPVMASQGDDEYAAILKSWAPEINYVNRPQKITAAWGYYEDDADEMTTKLVEAVVKGMEEEEENSGYPLDLGILKVATEEDAQAVVDAWAEEESWLSVTGSFELSVGLPIRPLDTIVAVNGPEGMDEFFDKEMIVTNVHHVFDDRGWTTRGTVRGLLTP